jgi:hypothetical protein
MNFFQSKTVPFNYVPSLNFCHMKLESTIFIVLGFDHWIDWIGWSSAWRIQDWQNQSWLNWTCLYNYGSEINFSNLIKIKVTWKKLHTCRHNVCFWGFFQWEIHNSLISRNDLFVVRMKSYWYRIGFWGLCGTDFRRDSMIGLIDGKILSGIAKPGPAIFVIVRAGIHWINLSCNFI